MATIKITGTMPAGHYGIPSHVNLSIEIPDDLIDRLAGRVRLAETERCRVGDVERERTVVADLYPEGTK